jgi:hypothetical protein
VDTVRQTLFVGLPTSHSDSESDAIVGVKITHAARREGMMQCLREVDMSQLFA